MVKFDIAVGEIVKLIEEANTSQLTEWGGLPGLAKKLHTSLDKGIPDPDPNHEARVTSYGFNKIPPKDSKSFFELMWEASQDSTLVLLIVSAIVSLILGMTFEDPSTGWIEGTAILFSVCIVVLVTASNDYAKEKQFRLLNAQVEDYKVPVIRGGTHKEISVHDLVVGDILELGVGDIIPVDGVLISGFDIRIDESSLTGESDFIKKNPENPFLLSGTKVMEGSGKYISVAVGKNSQAGIIKSLVMSDDTEESTSLLQDKLEVLALQIGYAGTFVAALCVLILYSRFFYEWFYGFHEWESDDFGLLLRYFITGITILVVAVPEGLPLAVTLSLAFSVQKMQKDNNLVKHLASCETMGSATTICSDKTGTLTTNRMTVMQSWFGGSRFSRPLKQNDLPESFCEVLFSAIALNSNAKLERDASGFSHVGNKTECALLQQIAELGADYEQLRVKTPLFHVFTFSSARKRMSSMIRLPDGRYRLFVKGASEMVLDLCSSSLMLDGEISSFGSRQVKDVTEKAILPFAEDGLRTISLAYRDFDELPIDWEDPEVLERDLICLGVVGIEDPVRPEVPEAIRKCTEAGIAVRMVTGDNLITARSIAKKCGLIHDGDDSLLIEGPEFRKRVLLEDGSVNQKEFDRIWPRLRVMARSSPTDKYTLVTGLLQTELKEKPVVAVTGDGTNDAPALRKADVGFAMGIVGTPIAKDACDIILIDDNFSSIVKAVKWGRNVYDSIGKFLQFQLTVNVVAIIIAVVGAFLLEESPLTAVQMLWVNLIMDSFASLALSTEPPTDDLLKRKPYARDQPLISRVMWLNILGHSLYQLVVMLGLIFWGEIWFGVPSGRGLEHDASPSVHYTIVFNVFVLLQLFNELNARKLHGEWWVFSGLMSNSIFLGIWVLTLCVQVLMVQFGGLPLRCSGLDLQQWVICLLIGSGSLFWHFVIRALQGFLLPVLPSTRVEVPEKPSVSPSGFADAANQLITQQRVVNHMHKLSSYRAQTGQSPLTFRAVAKEVQLAMKSPQQQRK